MSSEACLGRLVAMQKGMFCVVRKKALSWSDRCLWITSMCCVGLVGSRSVRSAVIYGCGGCVIFKKRPFQQVGMGAGWTIACQWQMPVMMA